MTKQRNPASVIPRASSVIPAQAGIQETANAYLREIAIRTDALKDLQAEAESFMQKIKANYASRIEAREVLLKSSITALMQTMKVNKVVLFDGTDVVNLANGSLVHSVADKVSIPKTALATCEALGFAEVVKIAKSLDREAIEKWPDERLFLIGAERKQKEEFSYDLKKEPLK